jgi:hypothetical protein
MSEKLTFRQLRADEIEVRVKTVSEKGATALLYKTARTDMDILDETVGADGWSCRYDEIHDNLFCTITIGDVSKQNCGIESKQEDGNEKKAEASDAFKRAGFCWGIGRELYTSPFIFLRVKTEKSGAKWIVSDYATFEVVEIDYTNKKISRLKIKDTKSGKTVFSFDAAKQAAFLADNDTEEPNDTEPDATEHAQPSEYVESETAKLRAIIINLAKTAKRDEPAAKKFCKDAIQMSTGKTVEFDDMDVGQLTFCKVKLAEKIAGK